MAKVNALSSHIAEILRYIAAKAKLRKMLPVKLPELEPVSMLGNPCDHVD